MCVCVCVCCVLQELESALTSFVQKLSQTGGSKSAEVKPTDHQSLEKVRYYQTSFIDISLTLAAQDADSSVSSLQHSTLDDASSQSFTQVCCICTPASLHFVYNEHVVACIVFLLPPSPSPSRSCSPEFIQ